MNRAVKIQYEFTEFHTVNSRKAICKALQGDF
jgi:hypothetical protein